ncbi:MAG: AAA family ATPase [Cyanobacteria bacterium P01_A01_bin.114]
MTSLDQLIQRNINPFDPTTFKPGNFWQETQDLHQEVASIHQGVLDDIEQALDAVSQDRATRTLLLAGDSGSGKSYLLGRLKRRLRDRACFVYIGPWPDSQFLWRHVLRQTVDSLVQVPEGQSDPQLIRWLRGLPAFCDRSMAKWVLGERRLFVRDLRASYPTGIYNAKEFFGVLYDLTHLELRPLAYDWLRGDDLDDDDLKALRVRQSIDSEDAAQKMLSNFGRIAASTQPMVLCFDNLDNIPLLPSGKPDLQSLLSVNSTIHNEKLSNFLILISIITSTWRQNQSVLQPADVARLHDKLVLKTINLDQAMALWASRLHPLHLQADPPPKSAIAPLSRQWLEHKYPGGKTLPRSALMLGQQLIQYFKEQREMPAEPAPTGAVPPTGKGGVTGSPRPKPPPPLPNLRASFGLVWQAEYQKVIQQLTRISQLSSPELIRRLQEVLEALQVVGVKTPFLKRTKFSAYSLVHEQPTHTGIVWTEDRNMQTFFYVMRACEKAMKECDRLYLLRAEKLGKASTKGYKLFKQIFAYAHYLHVQPDLKSVQMLETYHRLVNAACGGELVVGQTTPNLAKLQQLMRESELLNGCSLLQELEIMDEMPRSPSPASTRTSQKRSKPPVSGKNPLTGAQQAAHDHILNLMATQSLMGLQVLIDHAQTQIGNLSEADVRQVVDLLCDMQSLKILDPQAKLQEQLICWVPQDG